MCSLSPGLIATDMGKLEEKEGASMLEYAAKETPVFYCTCVYFINKNESRPPKTPAVGIFFIRVNKTNNIYH